jgi:hypothetical protein
VHSGKRTVCRRPAFATVDEGDRAAVVFDDLARDGEAGTGHKPPARLIDTSKTRSSRFCHFFITVAGWHQGGKQT